MKVVDMHCDTIGAIFENKANGIKSNLRENKLQLDAEKMKAGNYLLQNFAMFIDLEQYKNPYETLLKMIDLYYKEIEENKDIFAIAKCYNDIKVNSAAGKISSVLTLEEGGALEGKIENLQNIYDKGVRMITLTWNYPNGIGYPNFDGHLKVDESYDFSKANTKDGLTDFGIELVSEMERLGIIVDVSHLGDAGFYDVAKYSRKPFVASHSNARQVCNFARNLTDDMIRILAEKGGVTGINFCGDFVKPTPHKPMAYGTIDDLILHIKHIKNIGGIDCIGLGSDFDGIPDNIEISDGSKIGKLADALQKNGFTSSEIEKIFYKNVLRLYKELL